MLFVRLSQDIPLALGPLRRGCLDSIVGTNRAPPDRNRTYPDCPSTLKQRQISISYLLGAAEYPLQLLSIHTPHQLSQHG